MAVSKIRVTVPHTVKETFKKLSDHENLKNIVDQVTTSELYKISKESNDKNGLGAVRKITFNGDLLTEKVVAWYPPTETKLDDAALQSSTDSGYDYKVIAGKRTITDHLGVIRITQAGEESSHISWDIHLKVPIWAAGEIAAYIVCKKMEKDITESIIKNMS
jgi:hypothetical protein